MRIEDENLKAVYKLMANHVRNVSELAQLPSLINNAEWYVQPTHSVAELTYIVDDDLFIEPKTRFRFMYDHEHWKNSVVFA